MIKYINVYDLIFNGSDCDWQYEKPNEPYLVLIEDSSANIGRGQSTFFYKRRVICYEWMKQPTRGIDLDGASIGLYKDAQRWAIQNLQLFI